MIEFNYLREKRRMLDGLGRTDGICSHVECDECPLNDSIKIHGITCTRFEAMFPDEATAIVRKWAEEHPVKTRLDYFMECFPKARVKRVHENFCWEEMEGFKYDIGSCKENCKQCWNKPFEGWGDSGHD